MTTSISECDFNFAATKTVSNKYSVLDTFSKEIHEQNITKGFYDNERKLMRELKDEKSKKIMMNYIKAQRLALVTSELSEALEADRKDLMDDKLTQYKGFDVEIADTMIRLLDMCGAYGINIGEILEAKLEFNKARPYKHGKAY